MSKLLIILLGLIAFALLCWFCITRHLPEFMGAAAVPATNINANTNRNTNINTNVNAAPATPALTAEQKVTQGKINEKITGKVVEFGPGSDQLTAKGKAVLDELVPVFKEHPNDRLEVGGHTDSQGDDAKNLQLSERRAVSVKNYLVSKGLAESRFTTKGYGETQPIADDKTAEGRQKNRRIAFTVIGDQK